MNGASWRVLQLFGHIRRIICIGTWRGPSIITCTSEAIFVSSPGCALGKAAPRRWHLNGAGARAIAQRQRHVIGGADFADFANLVEEVFLMMRQAP